MHFERDVCEYWMETIASPKHFQHLQQHLQQQQHTHEGLYAIELQMERVVTQLFFKSLDQQTYKYHLIGQNLQKVSHLNLN
jgi:hypothetical protein